VFLDAIAAYGHYCEQVQARVDTAMLAEREDGDGWNLTKAQRLLKKRGWNNAEGIYDAAGIPEKHRRVLDLAVWGDPGKHKGRMFTTREIAELTGHPERTVMRWLSDDMPRLRRLADSEVA